MSRNLKLPWITLTWTLESGNRHTSLHQSLSVQLLFQQVCSLRCRAMNQQVTGSTNTERAVMNVLRWQAGYCSRTKHRGAVDWVLESKCQKMEQRRKSSDKFVRAAGERASGLEWKWNRFRVLRRNTKWSIIHECHGKLRRVTQQRQPFTKGTKNNNAWTRKVTSFCSQTITQRAAGGEISAGCESKKMYFQSN